MISSDQLITYCNLWLVLFGYILGLYTTLIILVFLDHQEEEESEVEEPALSKPCAWCWYEQHPYAFGFPALTSSTSICRRHAAEQRRLYLTAKGLFPRQQDAREEVLV